jgi:hypothetical protein
VIPIQERYGWEIETVDHKEVRQYNEDGSETPSTVIPVDEVVRASIVPRVPWLPRHDILLNHSRGEKFVRRFGRGFLKDQGEGIQLFEYLHCIVTTNYRLWIFSTTGQSLVTNPDYELYL